MQLGIFSSELLNLLAGVNVCTEFKSPRPAFLPPSLERQPMKNKMGYGEAPQYCDADMRQETSFRDKVT